MEQEKVNQLLMIMGSKIPSESIPMVRDRLLKSDMSESDFLILVNGMKDPTLSLILSILVGILGVDRFYIGDVGLGIGKLLTFGGCYIWALVDIFLIMGATKEKNLELPFNPHSLIAIWRNVITFVLDCKSKRKPLSTWYKSHQVGKSIDYFVVIKLLLFQS